MNLSKIADIRKEDQTESLKKEVYSLIRDFVNKYQTHYHPSYTGEKVDLISDFYTQFTDPTRVHRNGEKFSELDRFSHEKMGGEDWKEDAKKKLAQYTKTFVISRLIDRERQTLNTVSGSDGFEEGKANMNKPDLSNIEDEPDVSIDITSEEVLKSAIEKFNALPQEQKDLFIKEFKSAAGHGNLSQESKDFFRKVIGSTKPSSESHDEVKDKFPEIQDIRKYKLGGVDAVKITFDSKEDAKKAASNEELLKEYSDFDVYTVNGSNLYLKKK